jgi:hypothetical protein
VGILGNWPKWGDPESWSYVPTVPELYDLLMLNTLLGIPLSLIVFFSGSAKILLDLAKRLGFKSLYLEIILVSTSVLYLFDPSGLIVWALD